MIMRIISAGFFIILGFIFVSDWQMFAGSVFTEKAAAVQDFGLILTCVGMLLTKPILLDESKISERKPE